MIETVLPIKESFFVLTFCFTSMSNTDHEAGFFACKIYNKTQNDKNFPEILFMRFQRMTQSEKTMLICGFRELANKCIHELNKEYEKKEKRKLYNLAHILELKRFECAPARPARPESHEDEDLANHLWATLQI